MSYATIKAIWPGEKVSDLEELWNSWGLAPVVWRALSAMYLGNPSSWFFNPTYLWCLRDRKDIPKCLRAVLMMTFDYAYVEKKNYAQAAADIAESLRIMSPTEGHANHWPRVAELFKSDPDIPAIGFRCTSVSEDLFMGEWNEETEDYGPLDWRKCWSVYDDEALADTASAAA